MNVALFQMDVVWLDKEANLNKISEMLSSVQTDLVILPEMFNTGYIMNAESGAETIDGDTVQKLIKIAARNDVTIAGSIPLEKAGQYFNTFILVDKNGVKGQYDKVHLFTLSGEGDKYTAGKEIFDARIKDLRIRTLICYDLRFPYASFHKEARPDLIVYAANWPVSRIDQWKSLLKARAIENQCYVAGVNRVGADQNGLEYNGQSLLVDYTGKVILDLMDKEKIMNADLQLDEMMLYRQKLPFFDDTKSIIYRDI